MSGAWKALLDALMTEKQLNGVFCKRDISIEFDVIQLDIFKYQTFRFKVGSRSEKLNVIHSLLKQSSDLQKNLKFYSLYRVELPKWFHISFTLYSEENMCPQTTK